MPQVTNVTMRYSRKFQLGKDNWVGWDALVTVGVPETEYDAVDAADVRRMAEAEARQAVMDAIAEDIAAYHGQQAERQRAALPAPAPAGPPRTAEEAEQRFFARYGEIVGGESWLDVRSYLRMQEPKPTTVEGWIAAAAAVRDASRATETAPPEPPAAPRRASKPRAAA